MAEIAPTVMHRAPWGRAWCVYGTLPVTTAGGHLVTGLSQVHVAIGETPAVAVDVQVVINTEGTTPDSSGNDGKVFFDIDSNAEVHFMIIGHRHHEVSR